MNKPGFIEGVVVALVMCIAGSIGYSVVGVVCNDYDTWRVLIAAISFSYSIYLLWRSQQRTGRIIVTLSWLLMSVAIWLIEPSLLHYALIHLASLWLIRSLYFHASILSTLLDFGLIALGVAVALWALIHSGSLLLSLWCFFLVQAVFVTIPGKIKSVPTNQAVTNNNVKFQQAIRNAQSALNSLTSASID